MTIDELKQLQSLTLYNKIQRSASKILEFANIVGINNVYVSYSGGKDSTVLLHLVRAILGDQIPAVFANTGLEYPEVVAHVKDTPNTIIVRPKKTFKTIIQQYGYPVVSKDVSKTVWAYKRGAIWGVERMNDMTRDGKPFVRKGIYSRWKFLADAPFATNSGQCCYNFKESPIKKWETTIKKQTGIRPRPFVGTMTHESQKRKKDWLEHGCNTFNETNGRSTPLAFWTEQDILQYIYTHRLAIASVYGELLTDDTPRIQLSGVKRTGCMFCMYGVHLEKEPNRFQQMKISHPKIHAYCMKSIDKGGLGLGKILNYLGVKKE